MPDSIFLPAADIHSFVGKGNVDLGITGLDVILDAKMQQHVSETLKLEFGHCALQVQVPESVIINVLANRTTWDPLQMPGDICGPGARASTSFVH